jgi:SAM-dependent methyltransferase
MNQFILEYAKQIKKKIGKQSKVLEVGSLDINGSIRSVFKDAKTYIGIDPIAGAGVDKVMWSYDIPKVFKEGEFDCVICCETLEHDPNFWVTVNNIRWVLKKGGWLIISTPSLGTSLHRYPQDFFRFLPDAFLLFFNGFNKVEMVEAFDKIKSKEAVNIMAYGQK